MKSKEDVLSAESEEYLEAIYRLQERDGVAKTNLLARELGVVPGSITNTITHLEKHGLVVHEPYKGVRLTERGKKHALKVLRRHRLAERLLTDILHVNWSKAHKLACKLEHAITGDVSKSLEETLGNPKACPHGSPIPSENGVVAKPRLETLSKLKSGTKATVVMITDETPKVLECFEKIGLIPGVLVEVEGHRTPRNYLTIKIDEKSHDLSRKLASFVQVAPLLHERKRQREESNEQARMFEEEKNNAVALIALGEGVKGRVVFLLGGCGMVRRLADMGITPGTEIKVLKRCPFRGPVEVNVRDVCVALGYGVATKVFVRPL